MTDHRVKSLNKTNMMKDRDKNKYQTITTAICERNAPCSWEDLKKNLKKITDGVVKCS